MTNLNERIERVLKLDAERTQGEWVYFDNFVEINGRLEFENIGERSDASQDTEFIASAPEMAAIIREQRELLHRLAWIVNRGLYAHKVGASTRPSLLSLQTELAKAGISHIEDVVSVNCEANNTTSEQGSE